MDLRGQTLQGLAGPSGDVDLGTFFKGTYDGRSGPGAGLQAGDPDTPAMGRGIRAGRVVPA